MSPEILRETFVSKTSSYNLLRSDAFEECQVHSVYHGTESLSFLGPKIWDLVPVELKQRESLYSSKFKIKNWIPFEWPSRICKIYIQRAGFFENSMSLMSIAIAIIIFMIYVTAAIFW